MNSIPTQKCDSVARMPLQPPDIRPHEVIGGGYIVLRRDNKTGRLCAPTWPIEFDSFETASRNAMLAADIYTGESFAVVRVLSEFRESIDLPECSVEEKHLLSAVAALG